MKIVDISGQRFGKLVAIDRVGRKGHNTIWLVQCDCGNKTEALLSNIRSGKTKSCGCGVKAIEGDSGKKLNSVWRGMRRRCKEVNSISYPNYGAIGVTVCREWDQSYLKFKRWALASGYNPSLTLDRIDNSKGYSPDNCRWVTIEEQCNNKTNNVVLAFNGASKSVAQWAKHFKVNHSRILEHIKKHGKDSFQAYAEQGCKIRNRNTYQSN